MSAAVQRTDIIPYINGHQCGEGWLVFTHNPNAVSKTRKFINQKFESRSITRYAPVFAFECLMMLDKPEIHDIYDIAINMKTGEDAIVKVRLGGSVIMAETDFVVEISSFDDDDDMIIKGNLYYAGTSDDNNNSGG